MLAQVEADRLQHVKIMGHLIPQWLRAVDNILQKTTRQKVAPCCCFQSKHRTQQPNPSRSSCSKGSWELGNSSWGWARSVCTELQADGGATLGRWMPAEQHPLVFSKKGYGAHRQPSQAWSPQVGVQGTGTGEKGERMKHKAELCTTPAPHLVDKLPDVLLPQVVHHVLGKKRAVRHSSAQHTTISHKKRRRQSEDIDFKHLWALLAALPSQRAQTPQQRTQLPKVPSQGRPTLRAQICQGLRSPQSLCHHQL